MVENETEGEALPVPGVFDYSVPIISQRLTKMLEHGEGVLLNEATEPVHQMRVWSRRTRAALDIFESCFSEKEFTAFMREVKAVTGALGAARDMDVMVEALQQRAETLPTDQRGGIEGFILHLREDRANQQKAVAKAMERLKHHDLAQAFTALAERHPQKQATLGEKGKERKESEKKSKKIILNLDHPLLSIAAYVLWIRVDELLAYEAYLYQPEKVLELHEMRIAAKRLRYTLEIFQEVYAKHTSFGKEYGKAISMVKALQEHLGNIHDADVLVPLLTEYLASQLRPGYQTKKKAEPLVGVHLIDFDAGLGLLTLCRETRLAREEAYALLLQTWKQAQDTQQFANLCSLIREASVGTPALPAKTETQEREDYDPPSANHS